MLEMHFICEDCGKIFDEPASGYYRDENIRVSVCPHCHGSEWSELYPCQKCGNWYREWDIDEGYCEYCGSLIAERLKMFVEGEFTNEECHYLDWYISGSSLDNITVQDQTKMRQPKRWNLTSNSCSSKITA